MTSHANLALGALVLVGVVAHPLGAAVAPGAAPQTSASRSEQASNDAEFVKQAGTSGQQVVDASKTVLEQSTNADVKALAERMVQDHTVSLGELMSLAATPPVTPAPRPPATAPTVPPQTPAFERAYLAALVVAHDAMVALFAAEAADGKDERIKLWAQQKLPQLREHLELAKTAQRKVNALPPV